MFAGIWLSLAVSLSPSPPQDGWPLSPIAGERSRAKAMSMLDSETERAIKEHRQAHAARRYDIASGWWESD